MKRVIALLLCLVLCVCCFAACGDDTPEEVHSHTYSETWSSDAEGHWYMATCECEDVVETKLAHADKNNDGACDVCEYKTACAEGHSYSEDWTVDCTNHWNAADCGHIVPGANIAAHADGNEDGKCDVCNYMIEDIHVHYYDTAWTGDGEYHWHAALCEHGVEVTDKAAHILNAAGYCTVCDAKIQEIDPTDIEAVLAAAIARNDKVIDGNVTAAEIVYDGSGSSMYVYTANTNEVFYVLGETDSYIFYKSFDASGNYLGGDHQYHEKISDTEYICVQMEAGSHELTVVGSDAQFLNGYTYFPGSILPSDSDDTSTLANTLSAIYALAKAGKNVDNFTESYDTETGKYEFEFRYFTVNSTTMSDDSVQHQVELYGVAAEFYVDDNGVISIANFAVSSYRNWELDNDLTYDATNNTVTLLDSANPTIYAYSVSQRSGERTYTTPYPKASLVPVDFELSYVTGTDYDDGGKMYITTEELITDTNDDGVVDITLAKDEYVRLHLSSLIPYTAIASALNVDDFSMTFVNKDATKAGILWKDQDFLRPGYDGFMDCITFKVADPGEYTVTINFGDVTKVVDVTVPGEQPIVVPEDTATTKYVQTTDTYTWVDEYTYTAAESGTYTFTIPEGLGIWLETSAQPDIDYYSAIGGTVSFDLAAGKSITFQVSSTTKGLWEIGVSFVAGEVDSGDEGGEGGEGGEGSGSIAADISGTYYTADGVLVINSDGTMTYTVGTTVSNYTYVIEGDNVTYTLNGNTPYDKTASMAPYFGYLEFGADGKPTTFVYNGTHELSTTPPSDEDPVDPLSTLDGTYNALFYGTTLYVLTFDKAAGTLAIVDNNQGIYTGDYTYTYDATNGITVTGANIVFAVNESGDVTATFGAVATTLEASTSTGGGEDDGGNVIEPDNADGTFDVTVTDTYTWIDEYTFVAPVAGTYTFTLPAGLGFASESAMNNYDPEVDFYDNESGAAFSIELSAGEQLVFYVGSLTADTYTVEFTDDEDKIVYPTVNLYTGENEITVVEAQLVAGVNCSLYCWSDGDYTFALDGAQITVYNPLGEVMVTGTNSVTATLSSYREYAVVVVPAAAGKVTLNVTISYPVGSSENPETITAPATLNINLPGDYESYYYSFTATENGHLTLTYTNSNVNVQFDYETVASGASVPVIAGNTYTISVYSEAAQTDTMSVAFEAGEITAAEWFNIVAGYYYLADGTNLSINADGTLVHSYYSYTTYSDLFSYTYTGTLTADEDGVITIVPASDDSTVPALGNVTLVAAEYGYTVSVEGVYESIYTGDTEVEIEANDQDGVGYSYIAESAGTLTVTVTGYSYYDDATAAWTECPAEYLATMFARGSITLTVNGVVVTSNTTAVEVAVADIVTIQIACPTGQAIKAAVNVVFTESTAGGGDKGDEGDSGSTEPTGDASDPYIVDELPYTITVTGKHDVCYSYTATEETTIEVTYVSGALVTFTVGGEIVSADNSGSAYTYTVAAGTTLIINPWTMSTDEVEYTYVISVKQASEGGEEEGGGETSSVVTYMSERHTNGRYIKVEIDTTTGTATLTRSNMSGGWDANTATTTCTVANGTEVTCADTTVKVTFDANGVPTDITWGSAGGYTNFTVQA